MVFANTNHPLSNAVVQSGYNTNVEMNKYRDDPTVSKKNAIKFYGDLSDNPKKYPSYNKPFPHAEVQQLFSDCFPVDSHDSPNDNILFTKNDKSGFPTKLTHLLTFTKKEGDQSQQSLSIPVLHESTRAYTDNGKKGFKFSNYFVVSEKDPSTVIPNKPFIRLIQMQNLLLCVLEKTKKGNIVIAKVFESSVLRTDFRRNIIAYYEETPGGMHSDFNVKIERLEGTTRLDSFIGCLRTTNKSLLFPIDLAPFIKRSADKCDEMCQLILKNFKDIVFISDLDKCVDPRQIAIKTAADRSFKSFIILSQTLRSIEADFANEFSKDKKAPGNILEKAPDYQKRYQEAVGRLDKHLKQIEIAKRNELESKEDSKEEWVDAASEIDDAWVQVEKEVAQPDSLRKRLGFDTLD